MRLSTFRESAGKEKIDRNQVKNLTSYFLGHGFTYFDTAYIYGDGASEESFREAVVKKSERQVISSSIKFL